MSVFPFPPLACPLPPSPPCGRIWTEKWGESMTNKQAKICKAVRKYKTLGRIIPKSGVSDYMELQELLGPGALEFSDYDMTDETVVTLCDQLTETAGYPRLHQSQLSAYFSHILYPFPPHLPSRPGLPLPPSPLCGRIRTEKGGGTMAFPDFQDFIVSLEPDTVSGIMGDANRAAKAMRNVDLANKEDLPAAQVLSISYQTSLELLAVYHQWLSQYL